MESRRADTYHLAGPVTVHQGVGGNTKYGPSDDSVGGEFIQTPCTAMCASTTCASGKEPKVAFNSGSGSRQIGVRITQLHSGDHEKKTLPLSASFSLIGRWRS